VTCERCTQEREFPGRRWFTPSCVYCGARLIQRIKAMGLPRQEASARMTNALADWVAMGHSEQQIRALVKGPLAVEPKVK